MRLKILLRKAIKLKESVEFDGEGRGISFYTVSRTETCSDCKGTGRRKVKKIEDTCFLCEGEGEIMKTDVVQVKTDEGRTVISCSCSHCSIFSGVCPEVQCGTKLAVILKEAEGIN